MLTGVAGNYQSGFFSGWSSSVVVVVLMAMAQMWMAGYLTKKMSSACLRGDVGQRIHVVATYVKRGKSCVDAENVRESSIMAEGERALGV